MPARILRVRRGKNGDGRYVRLNVVALAALTELQEAGDAGPCCGVGAEAPATRASALTVRYSQLSPDFLQDAVENLFPPTPDQPIQPIPEPTPRPGWLSQTPTNSVHEVV